MIHIISITSLLKNFNTVAPLFTIIESLSLAFNSVKGGFAPI
jgi:hypothetical protein